jgi:hypothetical protein
LNVAAAYLIVVLAVAVLATLRWPMVGVCAFFLVDFLRPQDLHPDFAAVRPVLWLVGATLISTLWHAPATLPRAGRVVAPLAAMLAVAALSAASSDLEPQAWDGWIAFAKVAVIAVLVVAHVDSPRRFEAVLWVIAGSMSILALSTVVRGVAIGYPGTFTNTLGGLGAPVGPTGEGAMRDNNAFARVLVLSLPLCWILARQARRRSAKLLALLCGAVIVSGLVMTFSRTGGIAAAMVGAAALLWVRPRWKAVAVLLVVATLAFALAPEQYRGRLQSVSPDDWSLKLRYRIWARGLEMTKARPLLGVGIGTFTEHYARMAPPPKRSAHNVFIEVLAEMGVLGLLSYLALLAMVLWRLSRLAAARSEWTRVVARGLLLGLLGFLIMSTTLSHAFSSHLVAGLALAFALMSAAGRSAATARSEEASLRAHGTSIEALG